MDSFICDASGNLTSDGTHTFVYDGEGRVAKVDSGLAGEADYCYDSNNYRVKKVTSAGATTTYGIWDGGHVIAEYSTAPPSSSTAVKYYHSDGLSKRMITDASGTVIGTEDTLPFGEDAGTAGVTEQHRFTNYDRDGDGSDYGINRQYGPDVGRFRQPDPINGVIGNPQSLNRYAYAMGDPVNLTDPLGLSPQDNLIFDTSLPGPGYYVDGVRLIHGEEVVTFSTLLAMGAGTEAPVGWVPRRNSICRNYW
jgi:RHS repeat-associated protein